MKDKEIAKVLKESIESSLKSLSLHLVNTGVASAFFLHEKEDLIEEIEGKKYPMYGILLEAQTKGTTKKLYYRKYDTGTRSLSAIKAQAYQELLDVVMGTFVVTAVNASDETLRKLSITKELNNG
jgi:hypothetical protein